MIFTWMLLIFMMMSFTFSLSNTALFTSLDFVTSTPVPFKP
jgi:hypothetical protein